MRSVLVTALLANCGLFVPCLKSAIIPEYDAYFLRTSSFDIPSEGKSSLAVEMNDVRMIMRDSSNYSLIMMDEIGNLNKIIIIIILINNKINNLLRSWNIYKGWCCNIWCNFRVVK